MKLHNNISLYRDGIRFAAQQMNLPPEYVEKDGGVQFTIFKVSDDGQIGGQIGGQTGGQIDNLTDRQKEVLELIVANPKTTRKELAAKLDINESAVQKHLKVLTAEKIIERVGTNKGYWKILIEQ